MNSKSLDEWLKEAEHYSSLYYERYAKSFDSRNYSDAHRTHYCNISKSYFDLRELLWHIQKYGSYYTPQRCAACKHNEQNHTAKLHAMYLKYGKWIARFLKRP